MASAKAGGLLLGWFASNILALVLLIVTGWGILGGFIIGSVVTTLVLYLVVQWVVTALEPDDFVLDGRGVFGRNQ